MPRESQQALGDQGCWLYHAIQGGPGKLTEGVISVVGKDIRGKSRKSKRPQPVKKPRAMLCSACLRAGGQGRMNKKGCARRQGREHTGPDKGGLINH